MDSHVTKLIFWSDYNTEVKDYIYLLFRTSVKLRLSFYGKNTNLSSLRMRCGEEYQPKTEEVTEDGKR
jgi:hypothetical protein